MQATLQHLSENILEIEEPVTLEGGESLSDVTVHYTTFGNLNHNGTNVVWIFHALTGNSNPTDWWPGLFGENGYFDPDRDFIVCANMLGSCYGTTGPDDNGLNGRRFPFFTIRDIVSMHQRLRDHLGIRKIKVGIGGSMGGQQLLEWAVQEPNLFGSIIPIATNAVHSPWGIAFNEAQRMALDNIDKGKGLEAARAIAMLSYRSYHTFDQTQKDEDERWDQFSASSYQRYQGEKLRKRFNSRTYYYLSKAMDSHNIGRHAVSVTEALSRINSRALVIGISTDILFPNHEQQLIADHISGAQLKIIDSDYGHDGFLIETDQLNPLIKSFIDD